MKKIVYIITILLLSTISLNVNALRTSRYEPTFEADTEITDNQLALYFGWRGEEANKTTFKLEFDTSMIELRDVVAFDDFKVVYREESKNGNYKIYSFSFEADTVYPEKLFGGMVFTTTNKFNVGSSSELKVSDIFSYSTDGSKYRNEGYYINFKRESKKEMLAIRKDNETGEKITRSINYIIPVIIVIIIIVILLAVVFVIIPSTKHEDRKRMINAQLDPDNFPIPGVGSFPKISTKEKHDIIEPEEKTIQPLKEFLGKSDDVNESLKNKKLEVDKEMFKDNPTRGNEEGLTNVNPLAFDDDDDDMDEL